MIYLAHNFLMKWLSSMGLNPETAMLFRTLILSAIVVLLCILANWLTKKLIIYTEHRIIKRTRFTWDDIIAEHKVFNRLSHFAPAVIILAVNPAIFEEYPGWETAIREGTHIYMLIVSLLFIDALINALHSIYLTFPIATTRPIKGYVQLLKIILYFSALMILLSILFGVQVGKLFTGLGAFAAVLMLVFKDSILGFVASIQLSANKMVNVGDWIVMPGRGADGTVTDISLNTVKVQNWDKTISTIPTYALVSETFTNWRGMEESGGRRIKRHISIDMRSVKFCTPEMLAKYRRIHYLKEYIPAKEKELEEYNKKMGIDESVRVNGRRLTNLGTFRKYVEEYLRHHPKIHQNMTFLVRHLQPTETGLPLEIYVFSKDQEWARYEALQADIFDHILAVVPEFDLRVFQNPTGDDFRKLGMQAIP
ncbi:MAG: mechanosensitive ion channel family protein [Bacteroidales bacterium]